ncbi:Druantia anti-phage system protein DruA [Xanthomonas sp. XNM01]|uniref:Druantia anti-phage system protein DruA n=1 Tax=Xanthomonas sp. XNM01 TaxID=2769289 RepID=UPI00177E4E1B|nr:Druantia anti-phage system protein DruA [Xanthomonas sp. XNM01]MBD9370088.1 DUF4338 domain-containing protein [Xanthomonas sp. XNM01]
MLPLLVPAPSSQEAIPDLDGRRRILRVLSGGELAEDIAAAWDRSQVAVIRGDKAAIRSLHVKAKSYDNGADGKSLLADYKRLRRYFPQASTIDPSRISPELVPVGNHRSLEGKLFRLCRAYWSMPFSKGYGRRLRYLVMDQHHQAVIGIIGLQSPPADLLCRDEYLGATKENKLAIANTTMDAYTVGASPTYAPLLGGKLVAGFIHSEKIRQAYWRNYGKSETVILGKRLSQPLLAVTTTSAFGRSSIYNRLKIGDRLLAQPLGYTKGFGTIHLEELYPHIVAWLKDHDMHIPAGFGNGPKVRWQNIVRALSELGVNRNHLGHGIARQVYLFEFSSNIHEVHHEGATATMHDFSDDHWASHWKEKLCIKRIERNPDWASIDVDTMMREAISTFL